MKLLSSTAALFTLVMVAGSVAGINVQPLYLGYYDGLTSTTAAYTNLELAGTPEAAVAAHGLATHKIDALLSVRDTFFSGPGLHPDWESRWSAMVDVGKELLNNGTIIGFNLGDELVWNCIPSSNVSSAAAAVRADFPRGSAIIWYNEAAFFGRDRSGFENSCKEKVPDYTIPPDLDWFSTDIYHMDGAVTGWVDMYPRKFYETYIFPNLTSSQHALLVPGSFGSNVNHYPNGTYVCDNHCYDVMCAQDAHDFYSWAKADKRVAAIAPWNWFGCADCNGSRWTPPHTCCMDEIGTKDQPLASAAWQQIGESILNPSLSVA
eukprot:m.55291 g.55291  ORF g.55291 m.55291 type:complete len:320 (+) comp7592_c0_seq1:224-1183(+)